MTEAPAHLRWRLSVPPEGEEALEGWLLEVGASAMYRAAEPPHAYYAYFPPGHLGPDPQGLAAFPGVALLEAEAFADEDWLAKSREGFGAIEVGKAFYIQPLWETASAPAGRTPIVVNPGLGFGTGGHETTRLCRALLERLAERGELRGPVLDIGAGTGILALTAFLLGASDITAFDNDPDCGPAMTEFIALNAGSLDGQTPFQHFVGLLDHPKVKGPYALLLANILLETIQELLPAMADLTEPGQRLIASGILGEREDEALVSLAAHGFKPLEVLREGAWIAILAERA